MPTPLKSDFTRYLGEIQPTRAQRKLAADELSFLEQRLADYIRDDDPYDFVKALRSGSFAKATSLRRTVASDFDADLAVYVREANSDTPDTADLIAYVETLATRAYEKREKRPAKFERNESSVRVVFDVTPKINIDIVPIVWTDHHAIPNWGVLPKRDGTRCYTSVSEHIDFVRSRNDADVDVTFRHFVRIMKAWRNGIFEDDAAGYPRSFALELILGKAHDEQKGQLTGDPLHDLSHLAAWVIRHELEQPIVFPDTRVPPATVRHDSPVVVLDPINQNDNVTADWSVTDRDRFLDEIEALRDILRDAELEAPHDNDAAIRFLDQALPRFATSSRV